MADHVVIQVRDAVISRLSTAVTAVSGRVYRMSQEVTDADACPFLRVRVGPDNCERMAMNGGSNQPLILEDINLALFVHCVVKQDDDPEKEAYALRSAVETSLLGSNAGLTLSNTVVDTIRLGGSPEQDDTLDVEAYSLVLQLEIKIRHLESQPESFTY